MATLLTRSEMEEKLGRVFAPEQAGSLVEIFDAIRQIELERAADTRDLKQGLTELTEEVKKLTVAQQQATEQAVKFEEQAERGFAELRAAQQHLDGRMAELATAQQHLDGRMAELATAEQHTQSALIQLSQAVGSLGNTFGFNLEDFVADLLPPYLERHFGLTQLVLERRYFEITKGQTEEVDLVGNALQDGQPVTVLAECRTTIGGGEVRRIAKKLEAVAGELSGEFVRIVVAMNIHPTAEAAAQETGVLLVPYSRVNRER